jgi:hypothetical protein
VLHLQSAFLASAVHPQASHLQAAFFSHCEGHCATAVDAISAAISAIVDRNILIMNSFSQPL